MRLSIAAMLGLALVGVHARAAAADGRVVASGWYAEGGAGAVAYLPSASQYAAVGPALELRFGRDLFSWLSVGLEVAASSHEATTPPPPTGEWFQVYRGGADVRLGGLIGRVALFVEGGVGVAIISSNVLQKVGITGVDEYASLAITGGGGLEYQLENRHYAIGLGVDAVVMPQFDGLKAVDSHLYLRYTY